MRQIERTVLLSGQRLDTFLAEQCAEFTRSRLESLIKNDCVLVNGKVLNKSYKVKCGDKIIINVPPVSDGKPRASNMELNIVYEDSDILVLNKPKGIVVHPAPGHEGDTLVNGLLGHCGSSLSGINGEIRPGIVHRIDKDTSGLLVVAKNDKAHVGLSAQFEKHAIDRMYETVVIGHMPHSKGTIDAPIGRSLKDRKKMAVHVRNGKRAVTHYEVLHEYRGFSHLACRLETGRTHQIRVHLSSVGHFVVGDLVYGHAVPGLSLDFEGQCLHARELGFDHPLSGEHMLFQSDLPKYFENLLAKLERMK